MDVTTEELTEYLKIGFLVSLVFSVVGMVWGYITGTILNDVGIATFMSLDIGEVLSILVRFYLPTAVFISDGKILYTTSLVVILTVLVLFAIGLIIDGWAIKKLAEAGWIKL